MEKAYRNLFWGFIILTFHITIGWIQILPVFAGWLTIQYGVSLLNVNQNETYYKIARTIACIMAVYTFFTMVPALTPSSLLISSGLLVSMIEIAFIYCLFQGLTIWYQQIGETIKAKRCHDFLQRYLIAQTIFVIALVYCILQNNSIAVEVVLYGIIVRIFAISRFGKHRWYSLEQSDAVK